MAKGFTTRPRFHEEAAQRRVCPHCGSAEARRNGTRKGKQMFLCYACRKTWFGEMPPPPVEQICPYCKGYCTRHGTFLEPFEEWYREKTAVRDAAYERGEEISVEEDRPRKRFRRYRCTVCGKVNSELWPLRRPYKYEETCPYPVRILLDWTAAESLTEYCQTHKMSEAQAVRAIFGEAATRKMKAGVPGRPVMDFVDDDGVSPLPRLPNGNHRLWQERRERRSFGELTVCLVYATTVNLDRKAYIGLLRTILHYGLTRQEAARKLIREAGKGATPRFIGCVKPSDED